MKTANILSPLAFAALCAASADAAQLQTGDEFIQNYIRYQVWADGTVQAFFDVNTYGGGSCLDAGFPSPKSITIPETVDAADGYGPRTVTKLGAQAFYLLYEMEQVTLPRTIEWVRSSAFQGCLALKAVDLPDGVWRVDNSFMNCTSLDHMVFPSSVERADAGCLSGCSGMSMVVWLPSNPTPGRAYSAVSAPNADCEIYVPMKDLDALTGWDGRKFPLGPYVETPAVTSSTVTLEAAAQSRIGERAVEFTLGGVTRKAGESLKWEGLKADTDYTVTVTAEYRGHRYTDAILLRTAPDESGLTSTVAEGLDLKVERGAIIAPRGEAVYTLDGKRLVPSADGRYAVTPGIYTVTDGRHARKISVR